MAEGHDWPPRKGDLEKLYSEQRLSAAKIAKLYGLEYKNDKVAESVVLYHLRKNGIKRRDPAEHVRKVTEAIVDEWVSSYQAGESLKQIAGEAYSPATVMTHLDARGIRRREKVEAQVSAVTKHVKRQFEGNRDTEAYLIGFARGDLNVSRHGRAIRLKTATTHPLMIQHLNNLFSAYGHILVSPRKSDLAGYEWSFQVDLDPSFSFLLEYRRALPRWIYEKRYFLSFLAGFFDAEGSIWRNDTSVFGFEISLTNSDLRLLEMIRTRLRRLGFLLHLSKNKANSVWHLRIWDQAKIQGLLRLLPLRHPEKVLKVRLALGREDAISKNNYDDFATKWETLLEQIRSERDEFVRQAKAALVSDAGV